MLNILGGYVGLFVAWEAQKQGAVIRYRVAMTLAIINFILAPL